jgi:hypothetical protein
VFHKIKVIKQSFEKDKKAVIGLYKQIGIRINIKS